MKRHSIGNALACAGAVIGAGFASGREIAAFFSSYGWLGWWLLAIAAGMMTWLCWICLNRSGQTGAACWCDLFERKSAIVRYGAKICTMLLLIVTNGAMIAASGQMIALVWNIRYAWLIGAAGTLAAAWVVGRKSMRPLEWISGVLIVLLAVAVISGLGVSHERTVHLTTEITFFQSITAAVRAAAYATMNLTLAIGVVCRSAHEEREINLHTALCFGLMMLLMLGMNHLLLIRYPEWLGESFPLVRILTSFGQKGFYLGAILVYLSVFTSLAATLYALRCAVEVRTESPFARFALVICLPTLVSLMGFAQIVDRLYAPAGMICLFVVFYPLLRSCSA